jgi:capsular polysaccharide transport system permease protein
MRLMQLRRLTRALIFVDSQRQVPAARSGENMLVGTGTRLVPTVYEELRKQRRRRRLVMVLWIVIPTLIAALYYGIIASNGYVSETQMVLSEQGGAPGIGGMAGAAGKSSVLSLLGMGAGDSMQGDETAIVVNYLQSAEAMAALDQKIGLRKMWSAPSVDYFSRLPANASQEGFHKYYLKHITVTYDEADPVIELQAEAFRPEDAQLIVKTLVTLAQDKLNTAFTGMREDSLRFARSELTQSEHQLAAVNERLRVFRNENRDIDPKFSAQTVGSVTGGLFGQLAAAEANLRTVLSYAKPNSPQVRALKAHIDALKQQISADRGLLAGNATEKPYADRLAAYEDLLLDQKFAQDAYTAAMSFLATNRATLSHQQAYLVDFLTPTLPQDAMEPQRTRAVLLTLVVTALLWLTGSLVASALREHSRR